LKNVGAKLFTSRTFLPMPDQVINPTVENSDLRQFGPKSYVRSVLGPNCLRLPSKNL